MQIIPTKGFPVIHHIRTSIVEPTDANLGSGRLDETDGSLEVGEQGVFLNEYAIGKQGDVFPEGSGRLIKAGTKDQLPAACPLDRQGDTPTNVALGLKFYPAGYVPKHVISSTTVSAPQVDLRPHTDNIRSDGYLTLKKAARLLSFQPHMHNRGKAECLEAIYPTGRVETLSCAKFRFNWHSTTSTATMRRRSCRQARCCIRSCGTTTRPRTRSIRIRMPRSHTGSGRSMKWVRRGSAGTTCPTKISKRKPRRGGHVVRHVTSTR